MKPRSAGHLERWASCCTLSLNQPKFKRAIILALFFQPVVRNVINIRLGDFRTPAKTLHQNGKEYRCQVGVVQIAIFIHCHFSKYAAQPGGQAGRSLSLPPLTFALGLTVMNISPRHLAAAQYTMIAMFAVASWYLLLSPIEQARGQLDSMFSPGAENRKFFIWLVLANLLTVIMAVTFWFKRAASYPLALSLVCLSFALLAWALWWSDAAFISIYALGCIFSIWSWRKPNPSFKRDCRKSAAAP